MKQFNSRKFEPMIVAERVVGKGDGSVVLGDMEIIGDVSRMFVDSV